MVVCRLCFPWQSALSGRWCAPQSARRRQRRAAELSPVARCSDRLELILAAKRERTLSRSLGPVALSHRAEALAYSRGSGHRPTQCRSLAARVPRWCHSALAALASSSRPLKALVVGPQCHLGGVPWARPRGCPCRSSWPLRPLVVGPREPTWGGTLGQAWELPFSGAAPAGPRGSLSVEGTPA